MFLNLSQEGKSAVEDLREQCLSFTVWDTDAATQGMSDSIICKCDVGLKDLLDYQNYTDIQEVEEATVGLKTMNGNQAGKVGSVRLALHVD